MKIIWKGEGLQEKGYIKKNINKTSLNNLSSISLRQIIEVDQRYYRPSEVESLLGDATKARKKLGWKPKISFDEMVSEMIENDLKIAKRDELIKKHGYKNI